VETRNLAGEFRMKQISGATANLVMVKTIIDRVTKMPGDEADGFGGMGGLGSPPIGRFSCPSLPTGCLGGGVGGGGGCPGGGVGGGGGAP
jgi:hypothetical protein